MYLTSLQKAEIGEWIKENNLTIYCLQKTLWIQRCKCLNDDCKKLDAKRYTKQKPIIRQPNVLYQYHAK